MKTGKLIITLACLVAVGASLGACREDEQGRVLLYDKGVYLGKPDTPVSKQTRRALLIRIQRQNGLSGTQGGGSGSGTPPDTRPPASTPLGALRERVRRQRDN
ncbi:MAG: hypothetical protein IIC57_00865 [Proteobacteria bacterium]|nr:hypothetical protein [Pseudomonadota bacterium]